MKLHSPVLFAVQATSLSCSEISPTWCKAVDYFFLIITFIAIYYTNKTTSSSLINQKTKFEIVQDFIIEPQPTEPESLETTSTEEPKTEAQSEPEPEATTNEVKTEAEPIAGTTESQVKAEPEPESKTQSTTRTDGLVASITSLFTNCYRGVSKQ